MTKKRHRPSNTKNPEGVLSVTRDPDADQENVASAPLEPPNVAPIATASVPETTAERAEEEPTIIEQIGLADFSESSKIGALSALGYVTTYSFQAGYFSRFKAPRSFVLVELTMVFQTMVFLAIVVPFLWLVVEIVLSLEHSLVGHLPGYVRRKWLRAIHMTLLLTVVGWLIGFETELFVILYTLSTPVILLTLLTGYCASRHAAKGGPTKTPDSPPPKTGRTAKPSITLVLLETFGKKRLAILVFACVTGFLCTGIAYVLGATKASMRQTFPVVETGEVVAVGKMKALITSFAFFQERFNAHNLYF